MMDQKIHPTLNARHAKRTLLAAILHQNKKLNETPKATRNQFVQPHLQCCEIPTYHSAAELYVKLKIHLRLSLILALKHLVG